MRRAPRRVGARLRRRAWPAAALLALAGCALDDDAAGATEGDDGPRHGGTAVVAAATEVQNLNPLALENRDAQELQKFVLFTPLLRYDAALRPEPYGAVSWALNADSTELTFRLRDDLFWHDGVRTTAYDWLFSYALARDPRTAYILSSYWTHYGEAEALDSLTFRVRLRPHADFLDPWTAFAPVPRHLLEGVAPEALRDHAFGRRPVGNGPFRFAAREPGERWTFTANPDFPAALGGRPYLDRLVLRTLPQATTLVTELLIGGVDAVLRPPTDEVARLRASPAVEVLDHPDRAYTKISWNQRRAPFDDVRVRRALAHAIDRRRLVEGLRPGLAEVASSPVPPGFWQHDPVPDVDPAFDPALARRLLAASGYVDRDGDGVVQDAQGRPFRFTLLTAPSDGLLDVAQVVQADLRAVGVDVRIRPMEFNAMVARVFDPAARDFDAVLATVGLDLRIDDTDAFACARREGPFAVTGHCDPATDSLLAALPLTVDRAAALPLWRAYQQRIVEAQPYAFLFYPRAVTAVRRRLRDVRPDLRGEWVGVDRWWLAPDAAAPRAAR